MTFPFNVYLLALAGACLAAFVSVPLWRRWSARAGLVDDPGHRKIHAVPIPLAGGLAVLTGLVIPLAAGAALLALGLAEFGGRGFLVYGLLQRGAQLGVILLCAAGMVFLGWLDDKHELKPAWKFAGQMLIASLTFLAGVRITLFVESVLFSYAVTVLWIVTVTNAFNFMDNMNGLCGGLGVIGSWYFALSAALQGQYLVVILALLTCGALLGFLPFNFPKASIFLGDAGSHLAGYLMAVLAVLPHFYSPETPRTLAVLSPLLILAIPLIDLVWVVIIRWRLGRPFYIGDTNHISHRLVRSGFSPSISVLMIWLAAAIFGGLSFLL